MRKTSTSRQEPKTVATDPSQRPPETTQQGEDDLPPLEVLETLASLEERGLLTPEALAEFAQVAEEVRSELMIRDR
jgi:hypothetical protein